MGLQNKEFCVYCGSEGWTRDHLAPKGFRHVTSKWVRACMQCNGILNSAAVFTVRDRAGELYNRIMARPSNRKKYSRERLKCILKAAGRKYLIPVSAVKAKPNPRPDPVIKKITIIDARDAFISSSTKFSLKTDGIMDFVHASVNSLRCS